LIRRGIVIVALYGLVLHSVLSPAQLYSLSDETSPATALHVLSDICLTGSDQDGGAPAGHVGGKFCALCVRLAGLHLAPPPATVSVAAVRTASRPVVAPGAQDPLTTWQVRPQSRGPPAPTVA
jgi:hypothetical protein